MADDTAVRKKYDETKYAPSERKELPPGVLEKRMRLFNALNEYCQQQGAWVVSVPGHRVIRIECRKDSELPARLMSAGHDVRHAGSHTRIDGGEFLPVDILEIMLPGK